MFLFFIAVALGLIPASIASSKGHSFFLWWVYGSLLFIFALPHSIFIGSDFEEKATAALPNQTNGFDRKKWQTLKEVDADIKAAAEKAKAKGLTYEQALAEKYFVLNDKSYLENILTTVLAMPEEELSDVKHMYQANENGTYTIIKGDFFGRSFKTRDEVEAFLGSQ